MSDFFGDPQADREIGDRGGIVGIWSSHPAGVEFRLKDGSILMLWEGGEMHSRSWSFVAYGFTAENADDLDSPVAQDRGI